MPLTPQLWSLRAASVFVAAIFIQLCLETAAQDTIRIWRAGTSHEVECSLYTDRNDEHWLEFVFPAGSEPVRIFPSDHYFWLDNHVVGIRNRWRSLSVQPAHAKAVFELPRKAPNVIVLADPEVPVRISFLDWAALFGTETTGGFRSEMLLGARITNVLSTIDGAEIQVLTYNKERGSLKLNNALELVEVRLEHEQIPVFRPRLSNHREETWTTSIRSTTVSGTKGEKLRLWITTLQSEKDHHPTVAKAFLNGREVTWFGPRDAQFLVADGKLIGASIHKPEGILLREAIPTASMNNEFFTERNSKELERKYFRGEFFRIDNLAAELGRIDSGSAIVNSLKQDDDVFLILFSGIIDSRENLELLYAPQKHSAVLRIDRSERNVEVQRFSNRP
jgi:hypothetical protein